MQTSWGSHYSACHILSMLKFFRHLSLSMTLKFPTGALSKALTENSTCRDGYFNVVRKQKVRLFSISSLGWKNVRVFSLLLTRKWSSSVVPPAPSRYKRLTSAQIIPWCCLCVINVSPNPRPLATTDLVSIPLLLPFWEWHINGIIWFVVFWVWLLWPKCTWDSPNCWVY